MTKIKKHILCLLFVFAAVRIFSQEVNGFEFVDKEIGEILYSVSLFSGFPIVADDTVSGSASFRFAGTDFESAFESFLNTERLYVEKNDSVWTVSRIRLVKNENNYLLDAREVKSSRILEKISSYFGEEISYDVLPEKNLTVHTKGSDSRTLVSSIVRQLGESYELQVKDSNLHIARKEQQIPQKTVFFQHIEIERKFNEEDKEVFSVDIKDAVVREVFENLFMKAGKQFIFSAAGNTNIERACFENLSFEQTLELLCAESNLSWNCHESVYYIYRNSSGKNLILEGKKYWKNYSLAYKKSSVITREIQSKYRDAEIIAADEEKVFSCYGNDEVHSFVDQIIQLLDSEENCYLVRLMNIKTQELSSRLMPGVEKNQIVETADDSVFYFRGSENQYKKFCSLLKEIDVPVKQIRYDLLVVQYQNTKNSDWESNVSAKPLQFGDLNGITASLGSVLNFNLDVVSSFGLKFASSLQAAINENNAHVFADTTLHAIQGKTVSFTNTSTYRYRDNNVDPETGKPVYSGVTREIASGLKLEVTGSVNGHGEIICKVNASVSRQGADVSSKTGNPPPTSEKVITTEVRGKSGEPIVLSALIQKEEELSQSRVPLLSKIPLLGWLFKARHETAEETKLVIYLVPNYETDSIEKEEESVVEQRRNVLNEQQRLMNKYVFEGEKYEG